MRLHKHKDAPELVPRLRTVKDQREFNQLKKLYGVSGYALRKLLNTSRRTSNTTK